MKQCNCYTHHMRPLSIKVTSEKKYGRIEPRLRAHDFKILIHTNKFATILMMKETNEK